MQELYCDYGQGNIGRIMFFVDSVMLSASVNPTTSQQNNRLQQTLSSVCCTNWMSYRRDTDMDDQELEVKMREFGFTDKEIQFFHKYKELDSKETLTFQLKGLRRVLYGMPILYLVLTGIWVNTFLTKSNDEFIVFSMIMLFIAAVI